MDDQEEDIIDPHSLTYREIIRHFSYFCKSCKNTFKNTPLHAAILCLCLDVAKWFIDNMPQMIATRNRFGDTPLHMACKMEIPLIYIKTLLSRAGSDHTVNMADLMDKTPLMTVIVDLQHPSESYRFLLAELLLIHGANVKKHYEDREPLLHSAIGVRKNVDLVRLLIHYGANPFELHSDSETAFSLAARVGCPAIMNFLLTMYPIAIHARYNPSKSSVLSICISLGHFECFCMLLKFGADVNTFDNYGITALMEAAIVKSPSYIKKLLAAGASVNDKSHKGDTALLHAIRAENELSVQFLLACRADVNSANNKGVLPLVAAVQTQNSKIVAQLLAKKARLLTREERYECMYNTNEYSPLHEAVFLEKVDLVKFFVERMPHLLTVRNELGETPLFLACKLHVSIEILNVLLSRTPHRTVNLESDKRLTPLHAVMSDGTTSDSHNLEMIEILLNHGAHIDNCSIGAQPLLHRAIAFRMGIDIIRVLVHNGADPFEKNSSGETAFYLATVIGSAAILDFLLSMFPQGVHLESKPKKSSLLSQCIIRNYYDCVLVLFKYEADVNTPDCKGVTPLMEAANLNSSNATDYVKMLLTAGARVNDKSSTNYTALHYAANAANEASVLHLLQCGAETNIMTSDGKLPLHTAVKLQNYKMVSMLVNYQASPAVEDSSGNSALAVACYDADFNMLRILLSRYTLHSLRCTDKANCHPFCIAVRHIKNCDLLRYLFNSKLCDINFTVKETLHPLHNFGDVTLNLFGFYLNSTEYCGHNTSMFQELISLGVSINSVNGSIPALTVFLITSDVDDYKISIYTPSIRTVTELIRLGANVNNRSLQIPTTGWALNPLHSIAELRISLNIPDAFWVAYLLRKNSAIRLLKQYWAMPPIAVMLLDPFHPEEDFSYWFDYFSKYGIPHGTTISAHILCLINETVFQRRGEKQKLLSKFYSQVRTTPLTLKRMARFAVRANIAKKYPDHHLPTIIHTLSIPKTLKSFLKLDEP